MEITNIRAEIVHASIYSNYVFVIAETDEGVLGFGDATLDGMEFEVVAWVKRLSEKLVGRDVLADDLTVSGEGYSALATGAFSGGNVIESGILSAWHQKSVCLSDEMLVESIFVGD